MADYSVFDISLIAAVPNKQTNTMSKTIPKVSGQLCKLDFT